MVGGSVKRKEDRPFPDLMSGQTLDHDLWVSMDVYPHRCLDEIDGGRCMSESTEGTKGWHESVGETCQ